MMMIIMIMIMTTLTVVMVLSLMTGINRATSARLLLVGPTSKGLNWRHTASTTPTS
jgi:hypothetical protein